VPPGAVKILDPAAGAVRAAIVEVHEELVTRLVADDLEGDRREDAAGVSVVGDVILGGLFGGVRGDGKILLPRRN